jgi:hypothetical protein
MNPNEQAIVNLKKLLYQARFSDWINNDIFTFKWWVLLSALFIPWLIWYLLIDKSRFKEMLLYTLATSGVSILLDEIGTSLTMWAYPVELIPILPRLITINYSMVPIIYVLIYQHFPKWKSFIFANIFLSLVFAFILEPVLVWMKLYHLITWKYIYSVPTYLFAAIILKLLIEKAKCIQCNAICLKGDRGV